jgi:hypothetical protein
VAETLWKVDRDESIVGRGRPIAPLEESDDVQSRLRFLRVGKTSSFGTTVTTPRGIAPRT